MVQKILKKRPAQSTSLLTRKTDGVKQALQETAGLWRGRKINPTAYQRKLRKSYSKHGA